ncbi:hypothetical protein OHB07_28510 [Streptomyces sp. NBC_00111]|uniref:hypothetical protein n=1 Tax=unclassified Streptomyces TaxID=2593676 RepID=UPI002E36DC31|nr:hypothetical protein [Streptomyces sp. NBC_01460]
MSDLELSLELRDGEMALRASEGDPQITCVETVRQALSAARDHEVTDKSGTRHVLRLSLTLGETGSPDGELGTALAESDSTGAQHTPADETEHGVEFKGFPKKRLSTDQAHAVWAGLREGLPQTGPVAGFPLGCLTAVLRQVEVVAGSPTVEMYREAARQVAEKMTAKANWKVLEPFAQVIVSVDSAKVSEVQKVLVRRGGEGEIHPDTSSTELVFRMPMRQTFGIKAEIVEAARGKATCVVAFSHFGDVSAENLKVLTASVKK